MIKKSEFDELTFLFYVFSYLSFQRIDIQKSVLCEYTFLNYESLWLHLFIKGLTHKKACSCEHAFLNYESFFAYFLFKESKLVDKSAVSCNDRIVLDKVINYYLVFCCYYE